jgi:hypothetical protein
MKVTNNIIQYGIRGLGRIIQCFLDSRENRTKKDHKQKVATLALGSRQRVQQRERKWAKKSPRHDKSPKTFPW